MSVLLKWLRQLGLCMEAELIKQIPVANQLGEGVLWDQETQAVWWVDILQSKLYRYVVEADQLTEWETPERLCSFALVESSNKILAAFASGFAWYEPESGDVEWIQKVEEDNPGTRLNDGKADPKGNFWVGGVVEDEDTATDRTAFYCLNSDLVLSKQLDQISISNGLCWSPCGHYLYHTDTPTQLIRRYAVDGDTLGAGEDFANTEEGCFPDGSTCDSQGYVYNAEWGGSKVRCYQADGAVNADLAMSVSQPSCTAFGGKNLDLLFVTSAAVGLDDEEGAGDFFIFQTDRKGVPQARFKGQP